MAPPIVKRFIFSFGQNKWFGFLVFVVSVGMAGVVALLPPPSPPVTTYRAIGKLAFRTPPPAFTSTGTQLQQQSRTMSKEILLSPQVLLKLREKFNFSVEQILEIRDKKLTIVFPGEQTQTPQGEGEAQQTPQTNETQPEVITLEYKFTPPESDAQAREILATLMNQMIEYSRWLNTSQLRGKIEALQKRLSLVQKDLTAAEEKFYRYITKEGSDLLAIQDGSLFTAITTSQQRQREIKLALKEIEGQISSLEKQLGLTPKQAYTSSAFSADPIIANLRARILQNELQLERLRLDLRPEHPQIKALEKEQKVNEKLLQERAAELIGKDGVLTPLPSQIRKESNLDPARQQLANQLVGLQTQRDGLLKQLQSVENTEKELRSQYEKFPNKQLQQARLVQDVEFQRVIYQNITTSLVDAQSAEAETVSSLTIAQEPFVPPVEPYRQPKTNRLLILLAGASIGLFAGVGLIFLLATIDDRLHTPQELRDALSEREVPLLGLLPLLRILTEDGQTAAPILVDAAPNYLSFYERFRSNIRRLGPETAKVILITSIVNEEGKTVSAYNLAIASAHAGKRTLLVEADLRSPSKSEWLGVKLEPEASLSPLHYYGERSESISLVPGIENLYILPSPGPQRQAAAIIESSELQLLLKDVRGRFDLVIVDTPSLSKCNDALLLEPLTDGIVLVTRAGITRSSLLGEAIEQLAEAEVELFGAVINGVEDLAVTDTVFSTEARSNNLELVSNAEEVAVNTEKSP